MVPAASGERIMACSVPPGDIQVDTFAQWKFKIYG